MAAGAARQRELALRAAPGDAKARAALKETTKRSNAIKKAAEAEAAKVKKAAEKAAAAAAKKK